MGVFAPKYFLALVFGLSITLAIWFSAIQGQLVFKDENTNARRKEFKFECPSYFLSNFSDPVLESDKFNNEIRQYNNERRQILQLSNETEVIYYTLYSDIHIQMYKVGKNWQNQKDLVQYIKRNYQSYKLKAKLVDASLTRIYKLLNSDKCQYDLEKSCIENFHFEIFANSIKTDYRFIQREHWRVSDPSFYYYWFTFNPQTNQILENELSKDCENYLQNVTKETETVDFSINWN